MKKRGAIGYSFTFIITLLCLYWGCEQKHNPAVSALLVLDEVPRKFSSAYFEERILARPELTQPEIKYLKSTYKLTKGEYTIDVPLYEKPGFGLSATHSDEILRILRKIGMIPVFAKPSDSVPAFSLSEWKEVTCADPGAPKKESLRSDNGKEEILEWQKIQAENGTWWVAARDLLFKNEEETEGVVLRNFDLFKYPIFNIAYRIGRFERGMKVKSRGFLYPERIYKNSYLNVEIYDKQGWCPASNVVLNARTGVLKDDETLFDNPEDLKSNRNSNLVYGKMDLVPVLEVRKDGWVKVAVDSNEKFYYIKNGKEVISDDPLDIAFASYVREDYGRSKAVSKELADALGLSEKTSAIAQIPNVKEKLASLDAARKKLEEFLGKEDYKNSVFVRSGSPYSLAAYVQGLFEIVNESEYVLGTQKSSEPKVESKKGTVPLD